VCEWVGTAGNISARRADELCVRFLASVPGEKRKHTSMASHPWWPWPWASGDLEGTEEYRTVALRGFGSTNLSGLANAHSRCSATRSHEPKNCLLSPARFHSSAFISHLKRGCGLIRSSSTSSGCCSTGRDKVLCVVQALQEVSLV